MRRILLGLVLATLVVPAAATAQIDTRGKKSVSVGGFGMLSDGSTTGNVNGGITTFLTENVELGGDVQLNISSTSDGFGGSSTNTQGFLNARGRYNFVGQSLTVPFASLGLGKNVGGASTTLISIGGGAKRFINERVSLNGEANWQRMNISSDFGDSTSSAIMLLIGISIYSD